jgi:predicted nucleic acid-binding protein
MPMKMLIDTNIVIHREGATVVNEDIGILFRWLDKLNHSKFIHPVTAEELEKHKDPNVRKSIKIKLESYNVLKTKAPLSEEVRLVSEQFDKNQNDQNDTLIINELYNGRVDALITEDKQFFVKANLLGIADRVYTIDAFLEKAMAENPELAEYKVLSVRKDHLGNLNIADDFFSSLKEDYPNFKNWFNRKADETIYVCRQKDNPIALLYLKVETENENYSDIKPQFSGKKRLKIGTFKVTSNGVRLGERFLKIIFDNALLFNVDEIYITIFDKRIEQTRLINLLEAYGFTHHGYKYGPDGDELVFVRPFLHVANRYLPKLTFPFISNGGRIFIVPVYPDYHTELFPDSILRTESPANFTENEPHRNAISKVYISRSIERNLSAGDVIVFYRTGGYYKSVVSTIGVVESVIDNIVNEEDFIRLCGSRSVFSCEQLSEWWNFKPRYRPFIVNFLYAYSFPKRINMERLIQIGVIRSWDDAPRGFRQISVKNLKDILRETEANESIIVN